MTGLFKILGMFYLKQLPRGSIDPSFHFIAVEKGVWGFKTQLVKDLFEILKKFYPPEGVCESSSQGVLFTPHFIGIGKGVWGFKNTGGDRSVRNLQNVLSCEYRSQWGPIIFLYFIPQKETAKQIPMGFNCFYLCFIIKQSFHFIGIGKGV